MIIDIILLLILLYTAYRGYSLGLINEIFSFIAFFCAITLAITQYGLGADLLDKYFDFQSIRTAKICGFLFIFFLTIFIISLIKICIKFFIKITIGLWVDRLGGVIFGILKISLIFLLFINAINYFSIDIKNKFISSSKISPYLLKIGNISLEILKIVKEKYPILINNTYTKEIKNYLQELFEKYGYKNKAKQIDKKLNKKEKDKLKGFLDNINRENLKNIIDKISKLDIKTLKKIIADSEDTADFFIKLNQN